MKAELTPNLLVRDVFAYEGQHVLCVKRLRMRGAEDPTSPLDNVLHDDLGFEQVVACGEMKPVASMPRIVIQNAGRRGSAWGRQREPRPGSR